MATESVVRARIDEELKAEAVRTLDSMKLSVSDVLRAALVYVVEHKSLPFPVRTATGRVIRSALRKHIDETFLLEIHRARWAERRAEFLAAMRRATSPAERSAIQAQINEHYKHEHDLDWTRRALADRRSTRPGVSRARGLSMERRRNLDSKE